MKSTEVMKPGDFTNLADSYARYRPSYSESVLRAIFGIINKPVNTIDFADVGAGTGIWTRMVAKHHCKSVIAVEPNDAMRIQGQLANKGLNIFWQQGSAEKTHLPDQSADLLSMASSFHWANFDVATREFHRVLKPEGHFLILWNPRYLEANPVLMEIENAIYELNPNVNRVSSGKSKYVDELAKKLEQCPLFTDIVHLEGKHTSTLTKEEYMGVWRSVNDVRSQLGEQKFTQFLNFIAEKLKAYTSLDCTYQTRAWIVKRNCT